MRSSRWATGRSEPYERSASLALVTVRLWWLKMMPRDRSALFKCFFPCTAARKVCRFYSVVWSDPWWPWIYFCAPTEGIRLAWFRNFRAVYKIVNDFCDRNTVRDVKYTWLIYASYWCTQSFERFRKAWGRIPNWSSRSVTLRLHYVERNVKLQDGHPACWAEPLGAL